MKLLLVFVCVTAGAFQESELLTRGIALAQQGKFEEARSVLIEGMRLRSADGRFAIELGGIAYKQQQRAEAAKWLRRGLRVSPNDAYATEFLGTLYLLEGNTEAALKYWNRISKPVLGNLRLEPGLRLDRVLLDRAFTISPQEQVKLDDWRTTLSRLRGLKVFPTANLRLEARDDGKFDARLEALERNGLGNTRLEVLGSALRGIGFQTVNLDWTNLRGQAIQGSILLRWDRQKRRAGASWSAPMGNAARRRWSVSADLRDEQWELPVSRFGFQREAIEAGVYSMRSAGWTWSANGEVSNRRLISVGEFMPVGLQLKQSVKVGRELVMLPERRFESSLGFGASTARIWSTPSRSFEKLEAVFASSWFPRWKGDDYRFSQRLGAGTIAGQAPLDELFQLGLERDNDLVMRAHIGTRNGRKGSAPMGRRYLVSNTEVDKILYGNGIFKVKLSPFLDTGRIGMPISGTVPKWLFDTGVQVKVEALGVGFAVVYGKDLRSGSNTVYVMARLPGQ